MRRDTRFGLPCSSWSPDLESRQSIRSGMPADGNRDAIGTSTDLITLFAADINGA